MPLYTIPCHYILYHAIIYYTMPLYTIPCHYILYHDVIYYTMTLYTIPCHYILYHAIIYYTMPLYTIPCHYILYHVIIYYTMSLYTIRYAQPAMPFVIVGDEAFPFKQNGFSGVRTGEHRGWLRGWIFLYIRRCVMVGLKLS